MSTAPGAPFPVTAPYRVRADLARLGDERAVPSAVDAGPPTVVRDAPDWVDVLRERLDALEAEPQHVRARDASVPDGRLRAAAIAIARRAQTELPGRVRLDGEVVTAVRVGLRVAADGAVHALATGGRVDPDLRDRARALLESRPAGLRPLEALALALDEDLVLLADGADGAAAPAGGDVVGGDGASGRVAWLQVCFPSGWDPGAMAAASFERLHAPVPGAEALMRAAPAVVRAMLTKGPFVRYVWGLSPDGARSRHPARSRPMPSDHPLDDAWLRVERQTTLALPGTALALFAIGVHVTRLPEALASAARREAFAAAVASLGPAERRYKGVPWPTEAVRTWCDALP